MGWNKINYACGHGSYDKQLYGKMDSRERYVAWAEQNMVCPECYKSRKKAEQKIIDDKKTRIKILADMYDGIYTTDKGDVKIEVVSETQARVTVLSTDLLRQPERLEVTIEGLQYSIAAGKTQKKEVK